MTQVDPGTSRYFLTLLGEGQIPLGELKIGAESLMSGILDSLRDRLIGKSREWIADNSRWSKYTFTTQILWYPTQPVFFTFRDEHLVMIEFSDSSEQDMSWDYSLAVQQYFRLKEGIVNHLDKESWCHESDTRSMEVGWDFASLSLYLTCDVKSGGCGIGLRPLRH